MNSFEKIKEQWLSEEIGLCPSESKERIVESFNKLGVSPSAEVISLYSVLGGMKEVEMDGECFHLWSLDEIVTENNESSFYHRNKGVIFADHLLCSWFYRIKCVSPTQTKVYIDYLSEDDAPILKSNKLEGYFK